MTLPSTGWQGHGRPGFQCHALRHVASMQLLACDAFRYGDLSMTRVHVGLPTMACIPIRHREVIAREVVAALACIAMETRA
jgi:hypothetical protein